MLPVRWRAEARIELEAIVDHIAENNPSSALKLFDDIQRLISQLPDRPYMYRRGRVKGTRELVVHPSYLVVYRVGTASIDIISVLHTRRQYPST